MGMAMLRDQIEYLYIHFKTLPTKAFIASLCVLPTDQWVYMAEVLNSDLGAGKIISEVEILGFRGFHRVLLFLHFH